MALQLSQSDGVLTLCFDRPEKRNAVDEATARELLGALNEAEASTEIRVIVLRGSGEAFCAGRDVSSPPTAEMLGLAQKVVRAMVRCPKPVLCAVQGWAVGLGLEWMLAADIAVAARTAQFKLPEAALGVFVTGGAVATFARAAGLPRARGAMLLGETISADQAAQWGLIWAVVDDAALDTEVARIAARLAALAPDVVHRFKRVLNDVNLPDMDRALDLEAQTQKQLEKLQRRS
ncbi:MAG: enoyl-CoA hydratase/isomerase family protein [Burkholderiales bacterium]|nr:enoyl-CoA hydratase/isomerase family protein [Burkholderiales bacterium]